MTNEPGYKELSYRNLAKSTYLTHVREPEDRNKDLEREATIDTVVTGLPNDRAFFKMLKGLQARYRRDYSNGVINEGSFVVMDLVGLHATNDSFGKEAGGNDYLRAVSDTLRKVARAEDRFFRMGTSADEFVLYVPNAFTKSQLGGIMDRLDLELGNEQTRAQDKYPGIHFQLSYAASTFGKAYSPESAYRGASNNMGGAKVGVNGERVGHVGRLFDHTYNV